MLRPLALLTVLTPSPALAQEAGTHHVEEVRFEADGREVVAERGVLHVPVVRGREDSGTVALEYHRFHGPEEAADRPPIFLLHGGPGFTGLGGRVRSRYEGGLGDMARLADVVVVGQRGIGSSSPNTTCLGREREDLSRAVSYEEAAETLAEASARCRKHWEEQGLDLSGFTVIEAAADVIDVADVLGYERIVLTGGSFGSHWSMAIMREHPQRVARALLSGLEGPDHTYDMPSFVLGALERIAAAADAAPELQGRVPEGGFLRAFEQVIERVEAEPVVVVSGDTEVLLDARRVRDLSLGYTARASSRQGARTWPTDVLRLVEGDFTAAAQHHIRRNLFPRIGTASYFMLDCGSGISAERRAELLADPAAAIVGPLGHWYESTCPVWGSDLGEGFRVNFETDVPTVLVHGTWDTSTPFENALELAPFFTRGKLVVVEGGSHGALGEALRASAPFREAIEAFVATGEMEAVPELVELPALDWDVPE